MSQWTYIRGSVELSGDIYDKEVVNGKTKLHLPFPDDQIQLSSPKPYVYLTNKGEHRAGITFETIVYALPKCKPIIEEAMKMLPPGEYNIINYNLFQAEGRASSTSSYVRSCEKYAIRKRILEMYTTANDDFSFCKTFKELDQYLHFNISWVSHATELTLAISDSIRDCSGPQLMVALDKAFNYLFVKGIIPKGGYLEWIDCYEGKYRYAIRFGEFGDPNECLILDQKTNAIIASKSYKVKWNHDNWEPYLNITESDNWKEFIPKILYEKENKN